MGALTIVLADDHHVVRSGLRTLLEVELGAQIIGEAADGLAALQLVEQLRPDLLVVDLMMPGLAGLEVVRRVHERVPNTHVLVLSMHADEAYVLEALRAGAIGYVLKESQAAEFVQAVRDAAEGQRYLSPTLSERMITTYIQHVSATATDPYDLLTDRERDVLHLAALGCTALEIGERLALSARTAETYRTSVLRKLELRNQTDLVRYALKRGIISLDP
jgi:DNA-binding NarL/FixJ family response regulator